MAKMIVDDESSKLKNDALIYQKRDESDSKSEYEELDNKGKFQYFKDYYLKTILLVAAAVLIGVYYLYGAMTKPQNVLYIAIADDVFDDDQVEKLEQAAAKYLGLDGKRQVVKINTTYSHTNAESSRQLQSYFYAGSCDMVIASEDGFKAWAQLGYFLEPESSDLVSFYKDRDEKERLYVNVVDGEDFRGEKKADPAKYNFGISVKDCEKYKALKGLGETAYAGISNSSQHQEEAAAFLQYLLDDSLKDGDVNPDFAGKK